MIEPLIKEPTPTNNEGCIDAELVKQVLKGDKEAFDILVLKYQDPLTRVVANMIGEYTTALDVVQETFIKAYRSLDTFQGNSTFYTWVYRIAINTAKNYLKYRTRRPQDVDPELKEAVLEGQLDINDFAGPDSLLQRDEIQDAILSAVNLLPDELRTSLVLREMGGLSYDEIANVMQCPVGTVRSRIFRARMAIDERLKPMLSSKG